MDGGAWWTAVHEVAKSRTRLSDFTFTFHFHALEKEMATHSSVLAWRIPGMGEPGGLPSMQSHRVGHDWSDLAAAATPPSRTWLVSVFLLWIYPYIGFHGHTCSLMVVRCHCPSVSYPHCTQKGQKRKRRFQYRKKKYLFKNSKTHFINQNCHITVPERKESMVFWSQQTATPSHFLY